MKTQEQINSLIELAESRKDIFLKRYGLAHRAYLVCLTYNEYIILHITLDNIRFSKTTRYAFEPVSFEYVFNNAPDELKKIIIYNLELFK